MVQLANSLSACRALKRPDTAAGYSGLKGEITQICTEPCRDYLPATAIRFGFPHIWLSLFPTSIVDQTHCRTCGIRCRYYKAGQRCACSSRRLSVFFCPRYNNDESRSTDYCRLGSRKYRLALRPTPGEGAFCQSSSSGLNIPFSLRNSMTSFLSLERCCL